MKKLLLFLVLTISLSGFRTDSVLVHRLIVLSDSRLIIDGKTNVNSYSCAIPKYIGKDTLVLHEGGRNVRPVFVKGEVSLDARSFDCGIAPMTADFRKTINSKTHPVILIDFISFERAPSYQSGEEKFKSVVRISLAGVSKLFEMDCSIATTSAGLIHLKGGREFVFSDFNLEAPRHMLGLVKVDQSLHVGFHLALKLDTDR
ncbi:MAG: hypothetical protein HYZ44_15965 [Bacteroidetes bacterium]|nr:hypothetical protein [Bacteroidota bacterium]